MRISTRMTLALTAAGLVLFGGYGWLLVRTEERDLHESVQRELRLLGRSLQVSIENALRDRQIEDILETVEPFGGIRPGVEVRVHDLDGALVAGPPLETAAPQAGRDVAAAVIASGEARSLEPEGADRLYLGLPLRDEDGRTGGVVVLDRPIDDMRADLEATRRGVLLSVAAFVALSSLLGALIGTLWISRPLVRLASAMRRVRAGDLTSGLPVSPHGEVGMLAREFNAMIHDLREAQARLAEEAESRRQFTRAMQEADKLVAVGQLSAGLAHEIGSPLQVLSGRARILQRSADDPERVRKTADILVAQTDRIAHIVQQLLEFARRRQPWFAPVRIDEPVRAVLDLLEHEGRGRGVGFSLAISPDLPAAWADAHQVQQVVLNLVTNALRASAQGGRVDVRVEVAPPIGPGGPIPARARVRILVRDTGPGIPDEVKSRMFEPFFTTRASEGGTGLGLAVVKAIVDEHRGHVAFESSPAGTTFAVDLPAADGKGEEEDA